MYLFPLGKTRILYFILFLTVPILYGQNAKKSWLYPKKVGVLFNSTNEKNFLFDDADYFYQSDIVKGQLFYDLFSWKTIRFEALVQPQYHYIRHQLLNPSFVDPAIPNYEAVRDAFTKLKSISMYAVEFGLSIQIPVVKRLQTEITLGVGFAYIDTETERLARGFTFIENVSVGLSYATSPRFSIYFGGNVGHVSNFEFQQPNDGYNVVGYEVGIRYSLN